MTPRRTRTTHRRETIHRTFAIAACAASGLAAADALAQPAEVEIGGTCVYAQDSDGDGVANERTTYTFTSGGVYVRSEYDAGADGTVDSRVVYEYDAAGNRTAVVNDHDLDGSPNYASGYAWDAAGRMTERSTDSNGDGTPENTWRFFYDDAGRPVRVDVHEGGEDRVYRMTWDDDASTELREVVRGERVDLRATVFYDAAGRAVAIESDGRNFPRNESQHADGVVDYVRRETLDDAGNTLTAHVARDGEDLYLVERNTYDASGHRTIEEGLDATGTVTSVRRYEYDERGLQTSTTFDRDGDGVVDSSATYTYDAAGRMTSLHAYRGPGSVAHEIRLWSYDGDIPSIDCDQAVRDILPPVDTVGFAAF